MRRPLVLILCIMNACIAAGLLWFVFGNKPERSKMFEQPSAERLTDDELWERAQSATSTREASYQLGRIENIDRLKKKASQEIETLLLGNQAKLDRWPFLQAVLQKYGSIASSEEELQPLAKVTSNTDQPITLRDTAFRSYIENCLRFNAATENNGTPLILIDLLSKEDNSLAETALQAEHFLAKNGIELSTKRLPLFDERLTVVLEDRQRTESMRITAFNILSEKGSVSELPLETLYKGGGVRLQTAILHTLAPAGNKTSEQSKLWLEDIRPTTPEQEQLRLRILGQ